MLKVTRVGAALAASALLSTGFGAGGPSPATASSLAGCASATYPSAPKAYAARFTAAWSQGNRPSAACYAAAQVTTFAFSEDARTGAWSHVREVHIPGTDFTSEYYRNATGGQLSITVRMPSAGRSRAIIGLELAQSTGRVTAYTDKLVRAWSTGDKNAALRYATPEVVIRLWAISAGPGGSCWDRAYANADPADTQVSYTCLKNSTSVHLTVNPAAAAAGARQAVVAATGGHEG